MDRRIFLSALCASLACASAGYAASFEDAVVAQLRAQGYGKISIERTLLGRVRIIARMGAAKREIILNPRTGEILRDIVLDAQGNIAPQIAAASGNSGGSTSGSSSGTDDNGSDGGGSDDNGGDDNGGSDNGSDDNSDDGSDGDSDSNESDGGDSGGGDSGGDDSGDDN